MPRQDWLRSKFFREWAGPQRFIDAICLVTAKNAVAAIDVPTSSSPGPAADCICICRSATAKVEH